MFTIYLLVRMFRHTLRRLFGGEIPVWASDIYRALKLVNIVELLPTLAAILLTPRHFFRRIETIVEPRPSGIKKTIYKTPVNLITSVITLLFTFKWVTQIVTPLHLKLILMFLLMTLPLTIPMFCACSMIILAVSLLAASTFGVVRLSEGAKFENEIITYICVPLRLETYRKLDWHRMRIRVLYFYGYLISFPIFIAGISLWLLREAIVELLQDADWFHDLVETRYFWAFAALFAVFVCGRIVIYPYSSALIESMKLLPLSIVRVELRDIIFAMTDLSKVCRAYHRELRRVESGKPIRGHVTDAYDINLKFTELRQAWANFDPWWRSYLVRYRIPRENIEGERVRVMRATPIGILLQNLSAIPLEKDQEELIMDIFSTSITEQQMRQLTEDAEPKP